jgi:hypothetical protein
MPRSHNLDDLSAPTISSSYLGIPRLASDLIAADSKWAMMARSVALVRPSRGQDGDFLRCRGAASSRDGEPPCRTRYRLMD